MKKQENRDDHENENEQLATIFFTRKQLEVLFKLNRSKEVGGVLENQSKHENVIAIWDEPMKKVQP
jgi:hypothetical protein